MKGTIRNMKAGSKETENNAKRYMIYGCLYAAFCFIVIAVAFMIMNGLIEKNNVSQMNDTIGLLAEKVNVSFDMMTGYVKQEADILSVQENLSLEDEYYMLQNFPDKRDYLSVGIISSDGSLYCKDGEKIDLQKYEYDKMAVSNEEIYITEPYLSSVTGSNVITMFAPIYQEKQLVGNIYVTYPLETVQNLAKTEVLKHEVESYLMNGLSGNYITCSNSENHTSGVWGNMSLIKKDMTCSDGYDYNLWMENMQNNSDNNILCYTMNGIEYTQAYVKINCMENWFVVVRIPNAGLTNIMHKYLYCIGVCAVILIAGTLLFAFMLYFNEYRQKKKIEVISSVDPLTGLYNRRAFSEKLSRIFKDPFASMGSIYIFVDIDFFKEVNDTYGHAVGDEILRSVSDILKEVFNENSIVSRVGGDEFNILLTNINAIEKVEEMIRIFTEKLRNIHISNGKHFPVQCSIGMARYMKDADSLAELTECADKALYYVKNNGKNSFCWYSDIKAQ